MLKNTILLLIIFIASNASAQNIPNKNSSKKEIKTYLKSIEASKMLFCEFDNYIAFRSKESKMWGLMQDNKIIVKPYYDSIQVIDNQCPYFIVKKEDKYGVVPEFYKKNLKCKYEKVAVVKRDGKYYSLIYSKKKWGLYSPEFKFQLVGFDFAVKENVPLFQIEDEMYKYMSLAKKTYKANSFLTDEMNEDRVFIAKNKSNKWGMFQMEKQIVDMKYDSLGFYSVNSSVTIVKNNGKYGALNSPWGAKPAELVIDCNHAKLNYVKGFSGMLASKRDDKWAYIGSAKGDTLIPYVYNSLEELPEPTNHFVKHPMPVYPKKMLDLISDPSSVTEIDLRGMDLTSLPKEVFQCVNATTANLENNDLSDLPDDFFKLIKLERLYLGGNTGFSNFDKRFSKLINLKELYIGALHNNGLYAVNQYQVLSLDKSLGQLTKLEKLSIEGNFENGSMPNFIFQLQNLKLLSVKTTSVSKSINPSLEKLKCKSTLEILELGILNSLDNFNRNIGAFTNLKSISIETINEKTSPKGILNVKDLKYFKAMVWVKNTNSSSYSGKTVIDLSSWGWSSKAYTKNEKLEGLAKWTKFMKTNN